MSKKTRIKHTIFENINSQRKYGESKYDAHKESQRITRETGERQYTKGIFSFDTEDTYKKQSITFENWVLREHPEVRTLDDAKKYVGEFLLDNIERGLSANTVHTRAYALASAFKCDVKEFGVDLPPRKSSEAKRNRNAPPIEDFRKETQYIHRFTVATGARRCELKKLTVDCLKEENGKLLIFLDGKGGKKRWARVLEHERDFVRSVIESAKHSNYLRSDGCKKVFPDRLIPEKEPLHQHRKDYAHLLYDEVLRNGEHLIVDRGLYRCRGKNYGKVYNRTALSIVSKNLGHGQDHELPHEVKRVGVVVNHYMW